MNVSAHPAALDGMYVIRTSLPADAVDSVGAMRHCFLCMLAYNVKWHTGGAWRELLFADEDQKSLAERGPVAPATHSAGALEKVASKQLSDGSPAYGFRTLLNELSTIECTALF